MFPGEEPAGVGAAAEPAAEEMIFWRHANFREPADPAKGTIEAKLGGASRLAVCRGEVSGEGVALSRPVAVRQRSAAAVSPTPLRGKDRRCTRGGGGGTPAPG